MRCNSERGGSIFGCSQRKEGGEEQNDGKGEATPIGEGGKKTGDKVGVERK